VLSASRAASVVAQTSLELATDTGTTITVPTIQALEAGGWTAEAASYGAGVDEVVTQASLSAFKSTAKLVASEELATDAGLAFDSWLALELGGRLGTLQEAAFTNGDGSGKPLGIVHSTSPYAVSTAPVGNTVSFSAAAIQQFYLALGKEYRRDAVWLLAADDFGSWRGSPARAAASSSPACRKASRACSAGPS
jgi:HK97 family phage major capsid protein